MAISLYEGDLPAGLDLGSMVAIDTETMGLKTGRDRLCLVQLSGGDGHAHLVRIGMEKPGVASAPRLQALLADAGVTKLFHFARFDMAALNHHFGIMPHPVICTKIASKLCRTYTDRHGLKDLCAQLAGVDLSKLQQSSDWGSANLSEQQLAYAASDVLYLHTIWAKLSEMLAREGRLEMAQACFGFLATRVRLDLAGWPDEDLFAH